MCVYNPYYPTPCHDGPPSLRIRKMVESPHIEARHGQHSAPPEKKKKYKSLHEMLYDMMPHTAEPAYAYGIRKGSAGAYGDEGGTDDLKTKATKFVVKKGKEYALKVWKDCMKTSATRAECLRKSKVLWNKFGIKAQQGLNWVIGADPVTGKVNCYTTIFGRRTYKGWNPYCAGKALGLAGDFGGRHGGHSHRHKVTQPELYLHRRGLPHDSVKWEGVA